MPRRPDPTRLAGFTLIETMVALVILSVSLIAFYDFLSSAFNGAARIQAVSAAYDRHANALELATTINPMDNPEGTFNLGTYRVHWTSQTIRDVQQASGFPTGVGPFKVALYRVTLSFPDSPITPINVTRIGYRKDDTVSNFLTSTQPPPK
jgi:prepilin-type N-terminal cleavage/methylation domain-containing protein